MQQLKITPDFDFTYPETLSLFGMQMSFFFKGSDFYGQLLLSSAQRECVQLCSSHWQLRRILM